MKEILFLRKWKDLVDEWVKLSTPGETTASAIVGNNQNSQFVAFHKILWMNYRKLDKDHLSKV